MDEQNDQAEVTIGDEELHAVNQVVKVVEYEYDEHGRQLKVTSTETVYIGKPQEPQQDGEH